MHVVASLRPVDTAALIGRHDAAFRACGGRPQECVYDQTRRVVIAETFRELDLSARCHRYATTVGLRIRACEGYDPESKGKVEAGVKYVKGDGLYGATFPDFPALQAHLADWLAETANVRIHAVTGQSPRARYAREERAAMGAYLTPPGMTDGAQAPVQTRKADKTGLIAYRANQYSVPLAYPRAPVGVLEEGGQLLICALDSGEVLARHPLGCGKGEVFKHTHHYRDRSQQVAEREADLGGLLGEPLGGCLCDLLKATSPKHRQGPIARRQGRPEGPPAPRHGPGRDPLRSAAPDRHGAARRPRRRQRPPRTAGPSATTRQPPEPTPLSRYAGIAPDNRTGGAHDHH